MTNIDLVRDATIRMHGLVGVDEPYTFYYDETNNVRKLRVNEHGLNVVALKTFVLGGIVHKGSSREFDIQSLRKELRIQKSTPEIKLKHIGSGEFLDLLQSNRLTSFLRWLQQSDLNVHYQELDVFFWSLVDIIDSILPNLGNPHLLQYHMLLKSDFAEVMRYDFEGVTDIFYRYGYPGLDNSSSHEFLREVIEVVERCGDVLDSFNAMMLKGVLQGGLKLDALDFIEGSVPHLLIENFGGFYQSRTSLFRNANHILDTEDAIRGYFANTPITSGGQALNNYRFVDSKSEPGIQISDVVVGLLGKMYSYFETTPLEEVVDDRDRLDGVSVENVSLLSELISASDAMSMAFINHVASIHTIHRSGVFLGFEQ